MPLHGYTTDRRPPRNIDHLLAHPEAIVISILQIIVGIIIIVSAVISWRVSQSMARLPEGLLFVLAAMLLLGGVSIIVLLIVAGASAPFRHRSP